MANEINASAALSISKNGTIVSNSVSVVATLAGNAFAGYIQTIGTTREALTVPPDFTIGGFLLVKNLDATNFVTVLISDQAPGVAGTVAKLLPGEACLYKPAAGSAPFALADTASCDVSVTWTEL